MVKNMVTRAWKIYGVEGHRQRESFNKSYVYNWSEGSDTRIVEVENEDKTGTNEYSIVRITRNTEEECFDEFNAQLSDGIFENSRVGKIIEIANKSIKDVKEQIKNDWDAEDIEDIIEDLTFDDDLKVGDIVGLDEVWSGEGNVDTCRDIENNKITSWAEYYIIGNNGINSSINAIWEYEKDLIDLLPQFGIEYDELSEEEKEIIDGNYYGSFAERFGWEYAEKIQVKILDIEEV
jgi:hypothetical protein